MNGCGSRPTKMGRDRQVAVPRYLKSRTVNEGIPDERNGGIHGGGRRDLADLLPADEPVQNRKTQRESAGSDASSIGPSGSSSGDGWNLFSWFGSDSSSSDSSTSSSDSGGDSGGGGGDGGGSGGD